MVRGCLALGCGRSSLGNMGDDLNFRIRCLDQAWKVILLAGLLVGSH